MSYQPSIFVIEELKRMPINELKILFREAFLSPERLIKGDQVCLCDRPLRAFAKTMDKRLVQLMKTAVDYLQKEGKQLEDHFDNVAVYGDSHKLLADFNKLHCWDLVEMVRYRTYRFTRRGLEFLFGNIQIPRKVWVYNDKGKKGKRIIIEDDEMVDVNAVDDRWQTQKADYTFDYIIHRLEGDNRRVS